MKIDCYTHFAAPELLDYITERTGQPHELAGLFAAVPALWNVAHRLRLMDEVGVDRHVLVPVPVVPAPLSGKLAVDAARRCNAAVAQIVHDRPDRFSGVAMLPIGQHEPEAMAGELRFATRELGLLGGVLGIGPHLRPPDDPWYSELFATAAELDVPLWLHPARTPQSADYDHEPASRYGYWQAFGWINDDTAAMVRIALGGVFDRYPNLKLIVHHLGGMIPLFTQRLDEGLRFFATRVDASTESVVSTTYVHHLRKFYVDTATHGVSPLLVNAAIDFFGVDNVLFGSDAPMDADGGRLFASVSDRSIERAGLTTTQQHRVYGENFSRIAAI